MKIIQDIISPNKKTTLIAIGGIIFLISVAFISSAAFIFSEKDIVLTLPEIISASIEPTKKVQPGDVMLITAEVSDNYGISSVKADMAGIETITLNLINGSIYQGTWQAYWKVHSTEQKEYITTITAVNIKGKSSSVNITWTDPTWWNTAYAKRRVITITNNASSTLESGYDVNITFNHASYVTAGDSLASGNDIRIVYNDTTELDRAVTAGAWNSTSVTIIFRTRASISAGGNSGTSYYMYYKNSAAGTPPTNVSAYLFYDDFNDGNYDGWSGTAPVTVESGALKMPAPGAGDTYIYITNDMVSYNVPSFVFEYKLKGTTDSLAMRSMWKSIDSASGMPEYMFVFRNYYGQIPFVVYDNDNENILDNPQDLPPGGVFKSWKIIHNHLSNTEEISIYWEGVLKGTGSGTSTYGALYSGRIGFYQDCGPYAACVFYIDDVKVYTSISPAPTTALGSEEIYVSWIPRAPISPSGGGFLIF